MFWLLFFFQNSQLPPANLIVWGPILAPATTTLFGGFVWALVGCSTQQLTALFRPYSLLIALVGGLVLLTNVLGFYNYSSCKHPTLVLGTVHSVNYTTALAISLCFDPLSTPFFIVTLYIGLLAVFYSFFYMYGEVAQRRFVTLLTLFLFSMLFLLVSSNVVCIFLGWELIGLFSFLLIGFWTTKVTSSKAAYKALAYNQFSDACLFGFLVIYTLKLGSIELGIITTHLPNSLPTVAGLLLAGCVCCKSAQFPFFFWLPDSMEAPIPASSLIHSATLVSAGIFLLLKLKLLQTDKILQQTLATSACLTVVLGGLATITHTDLKKVLAFSTIANCGLLLLFALSGNTSVCFLYFTIHGIAKACSFFAVGICVLALDHRQDWRTGVLNSMHKKTTLIYLLPPLAVLGAWPGTITTLIKYANLGHVVAGLPQSALDAAMLVGSATSLVYSTKLVGMLTSATASKPTTSAAAASPLPTIAAATIGCALVLQTVLTNPQINHIEPYPSAWNITTLCREIYNFLPVAITAPLLLLNRRKGGVAHTAGLLGMGALYGVVIFY